MGNIVLVSSPAAREVIQKHACNYVYAHIIIFNIMVYTSAVGIMDTSAVHIMIYHSPDWF
jgi:hypothetical protein